LGIELVNPLTTKYHFRKKLNMRINWYGFYRYIISKIPEMKEHIKRKILTMGALTEFYFIHSYNPVQWFAPKLKESSSRRIKRRGQI